MLKVLDLFAGIGGFTLGLERAGMRTIAFCEIDDFRASILRKHWAGVPIFGDIRSLHADDLPEMPDVLTGGFPCRDMSGIRLVNPGLSGENSGLWSEYARLIGEIQPKYAIVENIERLLTGEGGAWFAQFLGDVASLGYDAEWHCIPAAYLGAPHIRDRIFVILTYPDCYDRGISTFLKKSIDGMEGQHDFWGELKRFDFGAGNHGRAYKRLGAYAFNDDGLPERLARLEATGRTVIPQIVEAIGRAIIENENTRRLDIPQRRRSRAL